MENTNGAFSEYYLFGRDYFGPFLYAYTDWLYQAVSADRIQKVFFFARDGYMMEKAFRLFLEQKDADIEAKYVYFSRKSIRQTLLWLCETYEQSLQYMSTARFISLGGLLEYYGFSVAEREKIAKERSLDLSEEFRYRELTANQTVRELYESLKGTIDEKSKAQDELLRRYIEQIGLTGRCAIVDIGWYGRIQNYLETSLAHHGLQAEISGYYLGIYPLAPLKGTVKGFLYCGKQPGRRKRVVVFLGGYEKLFQSREGSAYGYEERGGAIEPIRGTYEYENDPASRSRIASWQAAALDYVKNALTAGLRVDMKMVRRLVRFGQYPPLRGVRMFSFLRNNDGSDDYYVCHKSLWKYRPREFMYALSNSPWKTGFMRSAFKLPLPYYLIYYFMTK